MHHPTAFTIATLDVPNSISRSPLLRGFPVILLALALTFALSPTARAVTPAPDGGYPNGNTAEGDGALLNLTSGTNNTAIGFAALSSNTTGNNNTATGASALGNNNTASGFDALQNNTTGINNTADGVNALHSNNNGNFNTADGVNALSSNMTGNRNTATGYAALLTTQAALSISPWGTKPELISPLATTTST
jgi:predicted cobalt transporter CbtA